VTLYFTPIIIIKQVATNLVDTRDGQRVAHWETGLVVVIVSLSPTFPLVHGAG